MEHTGADHPSPCQRAVDAVLETLAGYDPASADPGTAAALGAGARSVLGPDAGVEPSALTALAVMMFTAGHLHALSGAPAPLQRVQQPSFVPAEWLQAPGAGGAAS